MTQVSTLRSVLIDTKHMDKYTVSRSGAYFYVVDRISRHLIRGMKWAMPRSQMYKTREDAEAVRDWLMQRDLNYTRSF